MTNSRRALSRLAPVVLSAFGLVILLLAARSFVGSSGFGYDFDAYDAAARRLASGLPLYPAGMAEAYNSGSYAGLYLYPPPLAVALIPLTAFGTDQAVLIWLWLRLAILVAGVALLPIPALARSAVLTVAALSFPVWYDINLGNLSVVLFALSAVVWRFRDRPVGSIGLAIAGVLRYPFGLVPLGWLAARRWRPVGWTILAGVVIVVATLPVVGIQGWLDYASSLRALGDVSSGPHNLSLATTAHAFGIPGPDVLWVVTGIAAPLLATVYAALRRDAEVTTVVALAGTILFFPFFHPHYLVELLIPAAFLAGRRQWWGLVLPLLGWLPGEVMPLVALGATIAPLLPAGLGGLSAGAGFRGAAGEFGTDPMRP